MRYHLRKSKDTNILSRNQISERSAPKHMRTTSYTNLRSSKLSELNRTKHSDPPSLFSSVYKLESTCIQMILSTKYCLPTILIMAYICYNTFSFLLSYTVRRRITTRLFLGDKTIVFFVVLSKYIKCSLQNKDRYAYRLIGIYSTDAAIRLAPNRCVNNV